MKIPYVNFALSWQKEKKNILKIVSTVFKKGEFIGGKEVDKFEKNIARYCGTKYAVSFNSGTDALTIGLLLLGVRKGDEVITPPNSFISSTSCIVHIGAKPVFVDVQDDQNIDPYKIENAITKKTKAIMPVHLTGRICEMKKILAISKKYNIPIIEDAAQSIGSKYCNKMAGSFGKIGCFSTHPLKNLNAAGDGGFFVTNDFKIYKKAQEMKNHGNVNRNKVNKFGYLSRMDAVQASILNFRLKGLNTVIKKRRANAKYFLKYLDRKIFFLVDEKKHQFNTYHTFVIQTKNRNKLIKFLKKKGIGCAIHYPTPIHLQPASKYLKNKKNSFPVTEYQSKKILTIPINQNLSIENIKYIVKVMNNFK
jgi:dTDP-4-amino-4,6-dideoxygalactose transaminase